MMETQDTALKVLQAQYDKFLEDYTEKQSEQREKIDMTKRHITKLEPDNLSLQIAIEKMRIEVVQMEQNIRELKAEKLERE